MSMPAILPEEPECVAKDCVSSLSIRDDDTEAIIKQRLEVYRAETEPVVEFYESCGLIEQVQISGGYAVMTEKFIEATCC